MKFQLVPGPREPTTLPWVLSPLLAANQGHTREFIIYWIPFCGYVDQIAVPPDDSGQNGGVLMIFRRFLSIFVDFLHFGRILIDFQCFCGLQ